MKIKRESNTSEVEFIFLNKKDFTKDLMDALVDLTIDLSKEDTRHFYLTLNKEENKLIEEAIIKYPLLFLPDRDIKNHYYLMNGIKITIKN